MLNIDKLRYTYEKPFLELMEGMETKNHVMYSDRILWYKDDGWYFELDEKNGQLLCQYDRVWSVFKTNYSSKSSDIQLIIKSLMERHYKLRGLTPKWLRSTISRGWKDTTNGKTLQIEDLTPPDRFTRK